MVRNLVRRNDVELPGVAQPNTGRTCGVTGAVRSCRNWESSTQHAHHRRRQYRGKPPTAWLTLNIGKFTVVALVTLQGIVFFQRRGGNLEENRISVDQAR